MSSLLYIKEKWGKEEKETILNATVILHLD